MHHAEYTAAVGEDGRGGEGRGGEGRRRKRREGRGGRGEERGGKEKEEEGGERRGETGKQINVTSLKYCTQFQQVVSTGKNSYTTNS